MEDLFLIVFIFGGGTLFLLSISPIGRAIAERIRGKGHQANAGELRSELAEHKGALEQELEAGRREGAGLGERGGLAGRVVPEARGGEGGGPGEGAGRACWSPA